MLDMRQMMDIVEGKEIVQEKAILASNVKTIQVEENPAGIMQAIMHLINPDKYENNSTVGNNGIMSFYTQEEYDETVRVFKRFGIKFKEEGVNNADGDYNIPDNTKSPYAGNETGSV